MLVLHGSWVPAQGAAAARFAVWGETARTARRRAQRRVAGAQAGRPPRHPYSATAGRLHDALATLQVDSSAKAEEAGVVARLPAAAGAPLASPELGVGDGAAGAAAPDLPAWRADALTFDAAGAVELLAALADDPTSLEVAVGDDLRYWSMVARLALELLYRQRFVPALRKEGAAYVARWRPVLDEAADVERVSALVEAMPPVCRALAWEATAAEPQPRELLLGCLEAMVDAPARQARPFGGRVQSPASPHPPAAPLRPLPVTPSRSLGEAWLEALQGDPIVRAQPRELATFYEQYRAWAEPAGAAAADSFRVCLRLEPPLADPDGQTVVAPRPQARDWTLSYLLQATDDPSLLVPAAEVWRQRGATARFVNRRFDEPHERLLTGLGRAARLFPPILSSLRMATPEACLLTVGESYDFVREKALLLQSSGFGVLVPGLETKLGVRVRLGGKASPGTVSGPGLFNWTSLVEYDWQLALGGEVLTRQEFEALARLKAPLVQVRGRWIELRADQLQQALTFFQRQAGGQLSLDEAIKLALAPDGAHGLPVVRVDTAGWFDDLLQELRDGGQREAVEEPPGFVGQLRAYQKVGVSWLAALRRYGLGACLADDMGLGKTIQVIALLLHQRRDGPGEVHAPTLLVCPTSVVGNWRRELARFAPEVQVLMHHGARRRKEEFAAEAARHDVVISTYALLYRDETELASVVWGDVILDEAQNIKNAATKAAQTARKLQTGWRAALTGTPVENRLADLWSIFQFLNPGYLGSAEAFRQRFARPIERARDAAATARLKALASPFILRRVKTDRAIIDDLPEKNEMKVFCTLTKEQGTLYEAVVQDALGQIEEAEGMQRRGLVLATLTKLKQVCNHPALFLHDSSQLAGRSGKLARLSEMLEEVTAVGDYALIFTQYAEMGKLLKEHLQEQFRREVLFLHGGTPAAERDRMVARFQGDGSERSQGTAPARLRPCNLFVLSIKAGGTGLNLTRASHVFHFDRWWNPAVENQATDRAFRIGQRRDVQVHKFVCAGTFEEAIDQLIERKVALSEAIVGTSEAWITEMNTEELRSLFALHHEAVGDE